MRYETKQDLRSDLVGKTVRWVGVTGAMPDTRCIELRLTDGRIVEVRATTYGTLEIEDLR